MNQRFSRIILASASPRRSSLLRQIGVDFEILAAHIDEAGHNSLIPSDQVQLLATQKAEHVVEQLESGLVIAADTLVSLTGHVLGKPKDTEDARRMLRLLSGRTHQVITGVALLEVESRLAQVWATTTAVHFRRLSSAEIKWYTATGEPMDKAGAYGIQEHAASFVTRIDGCYTNVVGLPLGELMRRLMTFPFA